MIKKCILTLAALCFFLISHTSPCIETERTLWTPWTLEHTQEWERIEGSDRSCSLFRRNEFFEDIHTLGQRDMNWGAFWNLLYNRIGQESPLPPLGFAILDKKTHQLIGTIRFTFSSKTGYVSLSYGLKASARQQKFGHEIATQGMKLIRNYIGSPLIALKSNVSKASFAAQWYEQGKLKQPDFKKLLNLFKKKSIPLKGLTASIDIINQPSLSIVLKKGMQPIEVECSKYYLHKEPNLYCFNILFLYPAITIDNQEYMNELLANILSRNEHNIHQVSTLLKNTFSIPHDWVYLSLNRDQKALLKLVQSKIITTTFLSHLKVRITTTHIHTPPYCFIL